MFRLAMITSILLLPQTLSAAEWQTESVNGYTAVFPAIQARAIERDATVPATDCAALMQQLAEDRRGIERCSINGSQPTSYCNLVKEDLKRTLMGAGGFNPDNVRQDYRVGLQLREPTTEDLVALAADRAVPQEALLKAQANLGEMRYLGHDAKLNSFTFLLSTAPLLEYEPQIKVVADVEGLRVVTNDRLSSCALENGDLSLKIVQNSSATIEVVEDFDAVESHFQVYQDLRKSWRNPWNHNQKLLWSGMLLGDLWQEHQAVEDFSALVGLYFAGLTGQAKLRSYPNQYAIGLKLPQQKRAFDYSQPIDISQR